MGDLLSRVLLVEDDEGDALLVRECLIEAGVPEIDILWQRTLSDGVGALDEAPGCVLLDLGLPDAEGMSGLHRLVSESAGVPVIVLTGRNDRTGIEAVTAGAQDYLVKDDITPELLHRAIRYAVERNRARTTELQLREEQMLSAENSRLERGLLPKPLLRDDRIKCVTYYQPGRNLAVLGGDFFDVVQTPDGRVRAVIGDVMGHGPDEAALGVHLRVAWRTLVLAGVPDEHILALLSRLLSAESSTGGQFVTACDITIDNRLGVTLRVAGHPAPLVCSDGRATYLDPEVGPPLGVEGLTGARRRWAATGGWPVSHTVIPPGASLILFTDGLLDAYRVPDSRTSLGVDELLEAAGAAVASGREVTSWIPSIVGNAPVRSIDDTAVVVLTAGRPSVDG
ncbi:MAG: PP2C family protein-serine/threonine phosphatase [Jatrophihabitantaceae bacterium]